jgi:DNA mismatch repair protein MutS2
MVDKTLEYIDYLRLLDVIQTYSLTSFVNERISGLRPLSALGEIEERQQKIEAVLEVIKWNGTVPLRDIPDIRTRLRQLSMKDLMLEASDFLAVVDFLTACRDILAFLKKAVSKTAYIESLIERITPLPQVVARIRKTVNAEGFVEDSASYELSKIRSDLYQFKEKVKKSLERMMEREDVKPVLQDSYIAIRNGRYVIPLKPNFNQFFQGIVHDYSHSLKTSFVEPVQIMELNNSISVLEKEEREEESRVLRELTDWTRQHVKDIELMFSLVSDLDFYHSLALFASEFKCVRPQVVMDGSIEVHEAVNPFISISKKEKTVPIEILMGKEKKAMIISGPNAGGKTVAMKTAGLLLAMASTGLFIPSRHNPRVHMFPSIYAVMGDEQNIAMELSTFTAHVEAIKYVYEQCRGGELVLIDEIGGSTEPQEASALSMGIIDSFVEKGCTIMVTTHLNLLKAYGSTQPFALNVATDFDSKTMKPLFRLLYGMAGLSNALKVAQNSGMPDEIIEKSYSYLGKQEHVLNDLIKGLEIEKRQAEEEKKKARHYREDARKRLELLKQKRDEYLRNVEERCRTKVSGLEAELEEIRKEVSKKDRESLRAAKEKISIVRKRFSPEEKVEESRIAVGDYVRVRTIGKEGYVAALDEQKGMTEIIVGNMRMRINREFVEKSVPKPGPRTEHIRVEVTEVDVPEVNVRGMRVEDALQEVDRFVDRAIVHGTPRLRILHGIGTGRLMNAIRNHLSEAGYVKEVRKDEKNSGVTIVELV